MSGTLTLLWKQLATSLAVGGSDWYSNENQQNFDAYIDARISAALGTPVTVKPFEIRQYCACVFDNEGNIQYLCGIHDVHFRKLQQAQTNVGYVLDAGASGTHKL